MRVTGNGFHLLFGRDDWSRCLDSDEPSALRLETWWHDPPTSPALAAPVPELDEERQELKLRGVPIVLPRTPGESLLAFEARRSAAADRYGNVYRVGPSKRTLHVYSRGSGHDSRFWPTEDPGQVDRRADFVAAGPAPAPTPAEFLAVAVTEDQYLVAGFRRAGASGFLSFDLVAGGPPVETLWPAQPALSAFDMAARCGGGVWVLDRENRRLWELDRRLGVVSRAQSAQTLSEAEIDDFQPLSGELRERAARVFPGGIDLAAPAVQAVDPVAIEALDCDRVLLLDGDTVGGRSRVLRLRRNGDTVQAEATAWLDVPAHDFVLGSARTRESDSTPERLLFLSTVEGNQVMAFALSDDAEPFGLRRLPELFPLRRHGGRALLAIGPHVYYDAGPEPPRWVPVTQQPRSRFEAQAQFVTPAFDAAEAQTIWDRVLVDACIPPDTRLSIESRAGDELTAALAPAGSADEEVPQVVGAWREEPVPYLRSEGAELPWLRAEAAHPTRRASGAGTWEVLLQSAQGRYLQLRVRLLSESGFSTPRIRALRVWYPRFSYPRKFLPAVYRESPHGGAFLERWLANFEGTLSGIEGRVANAQALFDARTAPTDVLPWLAQWFDLAFDPQWDEQRRRLLIRHAMDFFRWRGTVHGLRLALELAAYQCVDARMFDGPRVADERVQSIRIVEAYQTRRIGARAAGDPGVTDTGPREIRLTKTWSSAESNAGLVDRWARAQGRGAASLSEQIERFSLFPPSAQGEGLRRKWNAFCAEQLGFVPFVGAAERARWLRFIRVRRASDDELLRSHGLTGATLGASALPRDWPQSSAVRDDWRAFCAQDDGARMRAIWHDFLARRYRRIERLNRDWQTQWPEFRLVALPDVLPANETALLDWLQFEGRLLAAHRTAHRFSVLLPVTAVSGDPAESESRRRLALRIVELEKPAHTTFDVRFYWALNRIGEARLGVDTLLGQGSRAPELVPPAQLGRTYIGASFVTGMPRPAAADRLLAEC